MKITFLGTGTSQGVPVIACSCNVCQSSNPQDKRLRSSILIEIEDLRMVVDTGPDFRYQMLRAKVQKLDAVLFTHPHKDHIAGLDDVRAFNRLQGSAIDIYADEYVQEALKREFYYAFQPQKYFGIPQLNLHEINESQSFYIKNIEITPILVFHYRMPVLGFRIEDFAYITDAKTISKEEKDKLRGVKTLVLNALQKESHISHLTLSEAIELAEEIGAETTYFTHISHNMGLHEEVSQELPPQMHLAYDGLIINS